jgi:hypothetical protein
VLSVRRLVLRGDRSVHLPAAEAGSARQGTPAAAESCALKELLREWTDPLEPLPPAGEDQDRHSVEAAAVAAADLAAFHPAAVPPDVARQEVDAGAAAEASITGLLFLEGFRRAGDPACLGSARPARGRVNGRRI